MSGRASISHVHHAAFKAKRLGRTGSIFIETSAPSIERKHSGRRQTQAVADNTLGNAVLALHTKNKMLQAMRKQSTILSQQSRFDTPQGSRAPSRLPSYIPKQSRAASSGFPNADADKSSRNHSPSTRNNSPSTRNHSPQASAGTPSRSPPHFSRVTGKDVQS